MTTTTIDPIADSTTATPVEIDTFLADALGRYSRLLGLAKHYRFQAKGGYGNVEYNEAQADGYEDQASVIKSDEIDPLDAEFVRRGGWQRYYLVLNSNGHVHRGTNCTTCFDTTEYSWVTDLSDCDEDKAVAEFGELMCTVCFPLAPANPDPRRFLPGSRAAAERAARQAEKDEKAAAKAAKAITGTDGDVLRVPDGRRTKRNPETGLFEDTDQFRFAEVRTKIAARNLLSSRVQDYCFYGPNHPHRFQEAIPVLVEALERHGIETKPVIERAIKKAATDGASYRWEVAK